MVLAYISCTLGGCPTASAIPIPTIFALSSCRRLYILILQTQTWCCVRTHPFVSTFRCTNVSFLPLPRFSGRCLRCRNHLRNPNPSFLSLTSPNLTIHWRNCCNSSTPSLTLPSTPLTNSSTSSRQQPNTT